MQGKEDDLYKVSSNHILKALRYLSSIRKDIYIRETQVVLSPISKEAKDILAISDRYGKKLTEKEIIKELHYDPEQAKKCIKRACKIRALST